jgi:hypothetical protein
MSTVSSRRAIRQPVDLAPSHIHALAVASRKPAAETRYSLAPGAYEINAVFRVVGTLTVGHDGTTSATSTPSATELLALVLGKLNTVTRESILRELPAEFVAAGGRLPVAEPSLVEAADVLCKSLRQKIDQPRRGAVSGNLAIMPVADQPTGLRIAV